MAAQRFVKDSKEVDQFVRTIAEMVELSFPEVKKRLRGLVKDQGAGSVLELLVSYMQKDDSEGKSHWLNEVAVDVKLYGDDAPTPEESAYSDPISPPVMMETVHL